MQIWVDADACPKVIKNILFRAAERVGVCLIMVANQPVKIPRSRYIKAIKVSAGFDMADNKIIQQVQAGDLVITADIPLADAIIKKGAYGLNPRSEFYTADNIKQHLSMRNFMEELRSGGVDTGGPSPLSNADRQAFANELDRFLVSSRKQK
ncbi:MAG TPA: YaiI/YqxD family protein [Thioploca sp.]|nr:MAG: DUF188 domain-containing protein [Beggiatoa sp. 4572_84]RKZ56393.1 MAG: YaiI/YqxD family protein [Gammaproteobacteria bacterium]HDN27680.1 YaiI/YqxD family protein [Thioploca sp.]